MSLAEHQALVAKELEAAAGAKLEYSTHASFGERLAIRKIGGNVPGDRAVCGMWLSRQDLPTLREAIQQCFGAAAWPESVPSQPQPIQSRLAENLQKLFVELVPGQINAGAGTYSHWEPEAKEPESSGGNWREFL